jgi:hypothetical protein
MPTVFFLFQFGSSHFPTSKVDVILLVYLLGKMKKNIIKKGEKKELKNIETKYYKTNSWVGQI